MPRILTILLLTAYCLMAAFTTVEGEAGQGVAGRIIEADFFALGLFIPAFLLRGGLRMEVNFWLYLAFMGVMLVSLLLAARPGDGIIEYTVHVYNFAVGIALFNMCIGARDFSLSDAIYAFFYASGIVSVLCLLQFFVFPDLFAGKQIGGLVGTFRNTGQAGTYFGTGLALFIPAVAVGLIRRNLFNILILAMLVLCLVLTVKRAALLGLSVGVVGMMLASVFTGTLEDRRRNIAFFAMALVMVPVVLQVYDYAAKNVAGVENRFERKVDNFTVDEFMDKFFGENAAGALDAFEDRPLIGVGPNNIIGDYTDKYEIHSTPLSILSSTGVIGFTVYLLFLLHWLWTLWHAGSGRLMEQRFMRLVFPMVVGLVFSWGYTYHVRKREFWVIYAILMFGAYLIRRYQEANPSGPVRQRAVPRRVARRPASALAHPS